MSSDAPRRPLAEIPRPRRVLVAVAGIAAVVLFTTLYYVASVHSYAPNSDGATVLLEGAAIAHGHLGLAGWTLSLDSFWTVDAAFYALAVRTVGLHAALMHLVPALLAALAVVVGFRLCCLGRRRIEMAVAAAVLVVLVALPSHALSYFLLQGPWHVGTTLYCLVAIGCLRHNRFDWRLAVAVVVLAAGLLGDFQMVVFGVLPAFLAGIVGALRCRRWAGGLATVVAAIASVALAAVVRTVALAIGSFTLSTFHHTVSIRQLGKNFGNFFNWTSALFGVHAGPYGGPKEDSVVALPHAISMLAVAVVALVVFAGMVRGAVRGRDVEGDGRDSWRIDDLLVLSFCCSIGTFGLLTLSNNILYARYLDPVVLFGVVLAARVLGRAVCAVPRRVQLAGGVVWALVAVASIAGFVTELNAPSPVAPTAQLEKFLEQHRLTNGIGDYWAASIVTADSAGAIHVRPVVANLQQQISPDGRQAPISWYRNQRFAFIVYERAPYGRVDAATTLLSFGKPQASYVIGRYTVDTYGHPLVLHTAPFPKPQ